MDTFRWFLGALIVAPLVGQIYYLRPLKPSIVRAQLTFSEASFRKVLGCWSRDARHRFQAHFVADYAFILVYAPAGWAWWQGTALGHSLSWLLPWLLPAAAAFDVLENSLHQRFLRSVPGSVPSALYATAGLAASLKLALWLAFVLSACEVL